MMLCPKLQTYSRVRYVLFINLVWPSLNIQSHDSYKTIIIRKRRYPLAIESATDLTLFDLHLLWIDLIHDTCHLCMCFRTEWDKSNVTWFLSGQTSDKICQCKKSQLKLFILSKWSRQWINSNAKCTVGRVLKFFSVARWKILVASKYLWNFCSTAKQKNNNDFKTFFFTSLHVKHDL